ncbi:hypothetical protein GIB67_034452, partial [Kingdonia uniflora]
MCTCLSRSTASNASIRNTTWDQNSSSTSSLGGGERLGDYIIIVAIIFPAKTPMDRCWDVGFVGRC